MTLGEILIEAMEAVKQASSSVVDWSIDFNDDIDSDGKPWEEEE